MKHTIFFVILANLLLLSSCRDFREITQPNMVDLEGGLTRDDYRKTLAPTDDGFLQKDVEPIIPPLPDISNIILPPPDLPEDKIISISVTEDVSLKEVFMELARQADIDLEMDPGIEGGVIFRAKNKPFSEVIKRLTELAGLKYSMNSGILKIGFDSPYIVNYPVDFLNLTRTSTGSISVSTSVLSAGVSGNSSSGSGSGSSGGGSSGGGESLSTGSSSSITTDNPGDLWQSVSNDIKAILDNFKYNSTGFKRFTGLTEDKTNIDPISEQTFMQVNRQAGVITVMATDKQHKAVKNYLDNVKAIQSAQVLIEAKIVEVTLNDNYKNGIQWNVISREGFGFETAATFVNPTGFTEDTNLSTVRDAFVANISPPSAFGRDFTIDTILSFIENFGATKTISSPRINAMNNQQAVLTFAENEVFFTLEISEEQQTTDTGSIFEDTTIESTINTVPIGVILTLQPSINLETSEITMNIRPTLSRVNKRIEDPATAFLSANTGVPITNEVPVVEVRELDSILKIKSGQIMVIGGLMENRATNTESGIPGINKTPVIGRLFKSKDSVNEIVETVIFIKATILPGSSHLGEKDRDFYKTFTGNKGRKDALNLFNN